MKNRIILAGGGLVESPSGDLLMIFRNGRWDLPKGKLEDGEAIESCALREVCEECGLDESRLTLGRFLTETVHFYTLNGEQVEKHTSWYAMTYSGTEPLTPQLEEGITRAEWIAQAEACALAERSYGTIQSVFAAAFPTA